MSNQVETIQFDDMVRQLAKPGDAILATLHPKGVHMLHMAVGISGEVAELMESILHDDRTTMIEELGDIEFYFEGLCQGGGFTTLHEEIDAFKVPDDPTPRLIVVAGEILDVAKRVTIYNDPSQWGNFLPVAQKFRHTLSEFYAVTTADRELAIDANIKKLGKRYKGFNYSDQSAVQRADKEDG